MNIFEAMKGFITFLLVQAGLVQRMIANDANIAELIPRKLLFGTPERSLPKLSPDGKYLSFLGLSASGANNIWLQECAVEGAKPFQVTFEEGNGIMSYEWTYLPNKLVVSKDTNGDETVKLFLLDISDRNKLKFVNINEQQKEGIVTQFGAKSSRVPNKIIIAINDQDPSYSSLYEYDISTNTKRLMLQNSRFEVADMAIDNSLQLRMVAEVFDDESKIYYRPADSAKQLNLTSDAKDWVVYTKVLREDVPVTSPVGFSADNSMIYWIWGPGSDLGRLAVHPFGRPAENKYLFSPKRGPIRMSGGILIHSKDKTIISVHELYLKDEIHVVNDTFKSDLMYLQQLKPDGSPFVIDTSDDFFTWLIEYNSDQYPYEYWSYDRRLKQAKFLYSLKPELRNRAFAKTHSVTILARDGQEIPAYISVPPRVALSPQDKDGLIPVERQKMVVLLHGGPDERDYWGWPWGMGYLPHTVFHADRGYVVLQVQYRGSGGFGKKRENSGHGEWARKVSDDIVDAVDWTISKGITDPMQIAIMGTSYGGYSTMMALALTPDKFQCGTDISGPTNWVTLLENTQGSLLSFFTTTIGADVKTEAGREFIINRSPITFADKVKKPVMVMAGGIDTQVPRIHSDQIVRALRSHNIPVKYIFYPNDGHVFARPENIMSSVGFQEQFLAECLHNSRFEPYTLGMYNESAEIVDNVPPA